ncbi:MAG: aspartate/glutamate racemase family protein [Burkholderiaceae bacterium]|nr:aspartate/glutamate racemase family protein [Burkholderiaceae bacterium]
MIGVFDSGHGGLTILSELCATLPQQKFIYLADHAHAPYGSRPGPEIYEFTRCSVERLFEIGCRLVILACNTASTIALHRLQTEWLATHWPKNRILGVIVPTIEAITGVTWLARHRTVPERVGHVERTAIHAPRVVGVFATPATVRSQVYPIEIARRAPRIRVVQQACRELVGQIENGATRKQMAATIKADAGELASNLGGDRLDAILLGCTHFPLVRDLFEAEIDDGIDLVSQPRQVALALVDYLQRRPEFAGTPDGGAATGIDKCTLFTSGDPADVSMRAGQLFGRSLAFQALPG